MPDRSCKQFWSVENSSALHRHYSALNTRERRIVFFFLLEMERNDDTISAHGFITQKVSRSMRNREFVRQPHH